MNRKRFAAVNLVMICVWVLLAHPVAAQPKLPPHAFFGTVTIDGRPAPVGTSVEARGADVRTGIPGNPLETKFAGYYGGPTILEEKLIVQGPADDGGELTFFIDGQPAEVAEPGGEWRENYPFHSLGLTPLNLRRGGSSPSPSLSEIMERPTPVPPTPGPTAVATVLPTAIPPVIGVETDSTPVPAAPGVTQEAPANATAAPDAPVTTPTVAPPTSITSEVTNPTPGPANIADPTPTAEPRIEETGGQPIAEAGGAALAAAPAPLAEPTIRPTAVRPTPLADASPTPQVFAAVMADTGKATGARAESAPDNAAGGSVSNPAFVVGLAAAIVAALSLTPIVLIRRRRQRSLT
jgi:hypothetical protein